MISSQSWRDNFYFRCFSVPYDGITGLRVADDIQKASDAVVGADAIDGPKINIGWVIVVTDNTVGNAGRNVFARRFFNR